MYRGVVDGQAIFKIGTYEVTYLLCNLVKVNKKC